MRTDVDWPLLHVAYLEDLVMVDGELAVRTAFLFSTAILGDPVSVSVIYTRPGDEGAFTAALDRTSP